MTEEELKEKMDKDLEEIFNVKSIIDFQFDLMQKAYLKGIETGLKAGRPEWHKVTDGDVPKDENDVLVYSGEDWRMCVGKYFPKYKAWEAGCDTIAWCEIPKFKDKE